MAAKILIVTTSSKATPWGKDTGYWLEEVAAPYNTFVDAGFEVDIASIDGGNPPVDEGSLADSFQTEDCKRFSEDAKAQAKLSATKPVKDYLASASTYAAVFLPGGHGTVIDFKDSQDLKHVVEDVYAAGGVVSAVCHGPCGLLSLVDKSTGEPLVKGKKVTGFSDVEETQVGLIEKVPYSLEGELKKLGGAYENIDAWHPYVVVDGRLVTGQNPQSSKLCGEKVVQVLHSS